VFARGREEAARQLLHAWRGSATRARNHRSESDSPSESSRLQLTAATHAYNVTRGWSPLSAVLFDIRPVTHQRSSAESLLALFLSLSLSPPTHPFALLRPTHFLRRPRARPEHRISSHRCPLAIATLKANGTVR
jgi:hypothetical protein